MLDPGRAAQLCGERIGNEESVCANLLLTIFVKIFLIDSKSVIGQVILILYSQSLGLGIGYMDPCFHSVEICPV